MHYISRQVMKATTDGNPAEITLSNALALIIDLEDADAWIAYSITDLGIESNRFKLKASDGPHNVNLVAPWTGSLYFAFVTGAATNGVTVMSF